MPNCLIVIPAYNEEKNIRTVVTGLKKSGIKADILVVNDGSGDRTAIEAKNAGARVVSHAFNLGYGGALQTAFKYAVINDYDYVIQFDGDGQHSAEDALKIYDMLLKDKADIIIGSRFKSNNNTFKMGFMKKIAITVFRCLIRLLTGCRITDPTSGLQGLQREVFCYYSKMGNFPSDYPDADILIHMINQKFRVVETPACITRRKAGKSMHSGLKPIFYFVKIMLSIIVVMLKDTIEMRRAKSEGYY